MSNESDQEVEFEFGGDVLDWAEVNEKGDEEEKEEEEEEEEDVQDEEDEGVLPNEEAKENDVVGYDSTPGENLVEAGCVINCVKPKSDGAYRVYYASMTDKQNSHPLFVGFKHRNFNSMEEMIQDNCLTADYIQLIKETPINGFDRHIGCVGDNARKEHCLIFHQYNGHEIQYHTIKPFGTELPQELLSSVHGCGVVALLLYMGKK